MSFLLDSFANGLPWVYAVMVMAGTFVALRLVRFTDGDDES